MNIIIINLTAANSTDYYGIHLSMPRIWSGQIWIYPITHM